MLPLMPLLARLFQPHHAGVNIGQTAEDLIAIKHRLRDTILRKCKHRHSSHRERNVIPINHQIAVLFVVLNVRRFPGARWPAHNGNRALASTQSLWVEGRGTGETLIAGRPAIVTRLAQRAQVRGVVVTTITVNVIDNTGCTDTAFLQTEPAKRLPCKSSGAYDRIPMVVVAPLCGGLAPAFHHFGGVAGGVALGAGEGGVAGGGVDFGAGSGLAGVGAGADLFRPGAGFTSYRTLSRPPPYPSLLPPWRPSTPRGQRLPRGARSASACTWC